MLIAFLILTALVLGASVVLFAVYRSFATTLDVHWTLLHLLLHETNPELLRDLVGDGAPHEGEMP